jgi:hypothetical protein
MDETEEDRLADIFGKTFALGFSSIDEDLLDELGLLSKKLSIDLRETLEDRPQELEVLLEKLDISVTVKTATPEEMAGIKADADRQGYIVRTAKKPGVPEIVKLPRQKMAVIYVKGDPNVVCSQYLGALYTTVYGIKKILKEQGVDFNVEKLRVRWPGAENLPKDQWLGLYALPIPNNTTALPPQDKVPGVEVKMEDWEYGTVAEILHQGPYTEEGPTIEKLRKFIEQQGYQIVGEHEEEYIKGPLRTQPEKYQTIIRYRIKEKEGNPKRGKSVAEPQIIDTTESKGPGGIDFRAMPMVTQSTTVNVNNLNMPRVSQLNKINLDEEWDQIQNLLNADIIPSVERIKEYLQVCWQREDAGNQINKVLTCIADILRLEEKQVISTDEALWNLLVLLESK